MFLTCCWIFTQKLCSFDYQAVTILNLCIVHSDSLLDDVESYDALFYEIVRAAPTFEALAQMSKSCHICIRLKPSFSVDHVSCCSLASPKLPDAQKKGSPSQRRGLDLFNVQLIINHLHPKIEEWQKKHKIRSLTPQQVSGELMIGYFSECFKLINI